MNKILYGDELEKWCEQLGIDTTTDPREFSTRGGRRRASDAELQQRLIETERSKRESKLWVVAVISAIASVISAFTACIAVITGG